MPELTVATDVAVEPERAWAALTDWTRQREWMLGTTVRVTQGNGQAVGDQLHAVTGLRRLGLVDRMVITGWEPPRVCDVLHTGRVVRGPGRFIVEPAGTGSRVTWTEELDLPLGVVGRVGWPLVRPLARWGLQRSLERFARWARTYR